MAEIFLVERRGTRYEECDKEENHQPPPHGACHGSVSPLQRWSTVDDELPTHPKFIAAKTSRDIRGLATHLKGLNKNVDFLGGPSSSIASGFSIFRRSRDVKDLTREFSHNFPRGIIQEPGQEGNIHSLLVGPNQLPPFRRSPRIVDNT